MFGLGLLIVSRAYLNNLALAQGEGTPEIRAFNVWALTLLRMSPVWIP